MVAAEFWEQGDLERTVLDQQPIVSAFSYVFCLSPALCVLSLIHNNTHHLLLLLL